MKLWLPFCRSIHDEFFDPESETFFGLLVPASLAAHQLK
jgi:hypothetical protein